MQNNIDDTAVFKYVSALKILCFSLSLAQTWTFVGLVLHNWSHHQPLSVRRPDLDPKTKMVTHNDDNKKKKVQHVESDK